MSEQAPAGDLGGEVVVESWHGLTRAEIEVWATEKPNEPLYIARLNSDDGKPVETAKRIEDSINNLLTLFGKDPHKWQNDALKLHRDNAFFKEEEHKEYIQRSTTGKSAGQALVDWAEHNLLVEEQQDGMGTVHLILALSDTVKVSLRAVGDHWSGYHYRDPDNPGKILSEKWDDERIGELKDVHGDEGLEVVEYEVGFLFDCEARFMRPDNPDDILL